jgi:hypothetical protein
VGRAVVCRGSATEVDGRGGCLNAESCATLSTILCDVQPEASQFSSGAYTLSINVLVSPAAAGIPAPSAALLLDVRSHSPAEHLAVVIVPSSRSWRAERASGGQTAVLAERKDAALRGSAWMCISAAVADGRVSVECDGRPIFTGLALQGTNPARSGGQQPHGGLGLAAVRARLDFKALTVRPAAGGGGGAPSIPAPVAAAVPTKERYQGDDARLVEMVERDVMEARPGVEWEDIAALDDVKALLQVGDVDYRRNASPSFSPLHPLSIP